MNEGTEHETTEQEMQDIHFGFAVHGEDEPEAGMPYAFLEVNDQKVLEFADPWSVSELTGMMMKGAMRLAVKQLAYLDNISEEAAEAVAEVIMRIGPDVGVKAIPIEELGGLFNSLVNRNQSTEEPNG